MTDTQWLLDLVEEATAEPEWDEMAAIRYENRDKVKAKRSELNALSRDLARLCVEQNEALKRIADARSAYGIAEQGGAREIARAALARFEELKP